MADTTQLTLYAETLWISPYVFSSFVALQEKRLTFDVVEVSLLEGAQQRPEYRDRSLTGKVPALQHGTFWLSESSAIAEYLDDAFPAPAYPRLLPEAVRDRARARQLMAWLRSDLSALREERPTTTMFFERATAPLSRAGEEAAAKLLRVAGQLVSTNDNTLFGAWSLVDSELAFMLHRLILNGHEIPARIADYAATQWQRPSVRAFVQHPRPARLPPES
jgi:glutathione S-transferase